MVSFGTPAYIGIETGNAPMVFARPPDLQNGDIILLVLRAQEANSFLPFQVPAGFVEITTPVTAPMVTSRRIGGIFAKKVTNAAAEPTTYTVTSTTVRRVGAILTLRTEQTGDLTVVGKGSYGGDSLNAGIATIVARTNSSAGSISLVLMGSENVSGVSHIPTNKPAGYTEVFNVQHTLNSSTTASRTAMWFGYKVTPTTAFPQTSGGWSSGTGYALYEASITGGGVVNVPTYPGLPILVPAGEALMTYMGADGLEKVPSAMETWLPGFENHIQMENLIGATWAHRGGSNNWPEMSEWAYDHSVIRGYAALEFSAGRTSDGWWFGLHDQTTDRTSGGTFGNASSQTRAQVESQRIVNGASGGPRPYYGLIEFIAKYGHTHMLIFDFKYGWNYIDEFFDIIENNMDTSRAVYKEFGGPNANNSLNAQARGMKTWGYFYQAGYEDGSLGNSWQNYDYLGMDLTAGTAWTGPNNVTTFGKPVVGHIANSQAQYDLAISKGATMVQCSNVAGIKPVSPWL